MKVNLMYENHYPSSDVLLLCDTCLIMQEILSNEIEDEEFLNFAIMTNCTLLDA